LFGKLLRPSEDGRDLHGLGTEPVYNPEPADDNLSNVLLIALRHHSPRFRKRREAFNGRNNPAECEVA
jgi:hypothetical protein